MPISAGKVVILKRSHPPKYEAIVSTARENNCPPGAAVSPNITHMVVHIKRPAKIYYVLENNFDYNYYKAK